MLADHPRSRREEVWRHENPSPHRAGDRTALDRRRCRPGRARPRPDLHPRLRARSGVGARRARRSDRRQSALPRALGVPGPVPGGRSGDHPPRDLRRRDASADPLRSGAHESRCDPAAHRVAHPGAGAAPAGDRRCRRLRGQRPAVRCPAVPDHPAVSGGGGSQSIRVLIHPRHPISSFSAGAGAWRAIPPRCARRTAPRLRRTLSPAGGCAILQPAPPPRRREGRRGSFPAAGRDAMKALIAYDSGFGNTERVARAIGQALEARAEVEVWSVKDADASRLDDFDLVVVGSPTRAFRPTPDTSRFLARIPPGHARGPRRGGLRHSHRRGGYRQALAARAGASLWLCRPPDRPDAPEEGGPAGGSPRGLLRGRHRGTAQGGGTGASGGVGTKPDRAARLGFG
ncbi:MAG: hypothetical protein GF330_10845 [Candidatus Eisenbacteria bacterium]|nr:hypothetical protein [Candidatus Eisenbacteria bacterium]